MIGKMLVYIIRNGVGYLSCYAIIHLINSILYVLHFFFFQDVICNCVYLV